LRPCTINLNRSRRRTAWSLSGPPWRAKRRCGLETEGQSLPDEALLRGESRRERRSWDGCVQRLQCRRAQVPRRQCAEYLPDRVLRGAHAGERECIEMGQHDSVIRFFKRAFRRLIARWRNRPTSVGPPRRLRTDATQELLLRADGVLRKAGAGATLPLFRVMPACLHLGCVLREIDAKIQPHLLRSSLRRRTAFMSAPATADLCSGSGTVTPVACRMASALRRITSRTAPSIALSGE